MARIDSLKVVRFDVDIDVVPNVYPRGRLPWQLYQGVRNEVVRACRWHGPTGTMGLCKIIAGALEPDHQAWEVGDQVPDYYLDDYQYGNRLCLYARLYGDEPFNPYWLRDLVDVLERFPGWAIGVQNIRENSVFVFGDRLMVRGRALRLCSTVSDVVEAVGAFLDPRR
ncbi:MAG TPA: hypothetical protein VG406_22550 [Isosphaeraceae bacterium]|jgi:hypothetical protein|nr:hypothetical protein [Isosphaeraceae bacterium]